MIGQMATATVLALPGLNDLGRSVTPIFQIIFSTNFLCLTKKWRKPIHWKFQFFFKMHHQIPLFLALRLSVWWFQMTLEGLSFVKTLATFGIIYATDLILQNSWRRLFASSDSPLIFLNINPCRPCWITRSNFSKSG